MSSFKRAVPPKNLRGIPAAARFWNQVNLTPDDPLAQSKGCWLWTGHTDKDGYGRLRVDGKAIGAHVFSFELTYGKLPAGKWALHTCDRRNCVRPDHLYAGDAAANTDDMLERDRSARGERNSHAKLTADQVLAMRALYEGGEHNKSKIARLFNVTNMLVGKIIRRELWKHI